MKKILSLVLLATLMLSQPSVANEWFKKEEPLQQPPAVTEPVIPKTVDPRLKKSQAIILKQPCDMFPKIADILQKHKEELLFSGSGMTFSINGQPYRGGMMFFTNQTTGSWTIVQTFADGMSCMIFNGREFKPYSGEQPKYK